MAPPLNISATHQLVVLEKWRNASASTPGSALRDKSEHNQQPEGNENTAP